MKKFKRHRDYGFFNQDIRLSKFSTLGDPLERLNNHVDFEMFRTLLQDTLTKESKGECGRQLYEYVMMFKVLILQRYYNKYDDQIECQINEANEFYAFFEFNHCR